MKGLLSRSGDTSGAADSLVSLRTRSSSSTRVVTMLVPAADGKAEPPSDTLPPNSLCNANDD